LNAETKAWTAASGWDADADELGFAAPCWLAIALLTGGDPASAANAHKAIILGMVFLPWMPFCGSSHRLPSVPNKAG
jgi:hypothetical protein